MRKPLFLAAAIAATAISTAVTNTIGSTALPAGLRDQRAAESHDIALFQPHAIHLLPRLCRADVRDHPHRPLVG
jgi:hypothetical protein